MTKFYKKGYPRPQFVRESFFSLNGEWNFRFDPRKEGIKCGWQNGFEDRKIIVPFSYESPAGGIGVQDECNVVWYSRSQSFELHEGKRILLNFEGSDYRTELWVNGIYMGVHEGGYTRFTFDITEALKKRGISWSAALKIPIRPYSPEENSGGLNKIMTAGIPRQRESGRMYGQKKLTAVI